MVINEFFKSIFRTLGRITAYIILGILAYLIFSWFGFESSKVNAATITPNTLSPYGINTGGQSWGQTFYNTNSYNLSQTSSNFIYVNGTTAYFPVNVLSGNTYTLEFTIDYTLYHENISFNPTLVFYLDNVTTTCDTNITNTIIQTSTTQYNYGARHTFKCLVDTTINGSTFSMNYYTGLQQTIKSFTINFNFYKEDATAQDIINNNNYNTDREIFNWNYNTDRIITADWNHSRDVINSQNANTEAIENLDNTMKDESSASNILIQGVQGIVPSGPATQLLQLPFTMINSMYDGFNATCSAWNINTGPLLGNHVWTIPCINLARRLGSDVWSYQGFSLWQIIDIMGFIFMVYEIIMLMINGYNMIAELNDPWEVLYVPQHGGFNTRSGRNYVEY